MAVPNDVSMRFIPLDDLKFDPHNPRLPGSFNAKNENDVINWMLGDASLIELMGSIGEQGYFPGEPLLGVRDQDGKIIIVEGNRRLASAKLLLHPELATIKKNSVQNVAAEALEKPLQLPVLVYSNREEILSYLGYRHVTGIKAWDPLAKARYLKQLYDIERNNNKDNESTFRILAKKIGSRADYVARLLTGYAIFVKIEECDFFNIKGLNEDSIDFSILTTGLNYANISSYLGLTSTNDPSLDNLEVDHLSELTNWLFAKNSEGKTRIGESRNLSKLSQIISNAKALEAWKQGVTLEHAITLTETPSEIFKNSIFKAHDQIVTARNYSHLVDKPENSLVDILFEVRNITIDLYTLMSDRLK
ncbi:MAG: ParB/RepB/Spo0J family partition protein [Chloroflexi bacterium]|nr:ParB/RepB/Spo0J family partition protein [Chloroflexota bacterium]